MGGQACVFYGAAQVSKDVDLVLLASEENFSRLLRRVGAIQREAHRRAADSIPPCWRAATRCISAARAATLTGCAWTS